MFFLRCFCFQPKFTPSRIMRTRIFVSLFPCLFTTNFSTFPVRRKKRFYARLEPENNPNTSTHKTPSKLPIVIQLIPSSQKKSFPLKNFDYKKHLHSLFHPINTVHTILDRFKVFPSRELSLLEVKERKINENRFMKFFFSLLSFSLSMLNIFQVSILSVRIFPEKEGREAKNGREDGRKGVFLGSGVL